MTKPWPACCVAPLLVLAGCDDEAMQPESGCDAAAISVGVAIDGSSGVRATPTGYLVPLVVRASIPCLDGVARAAVAASAGELTSTVVTLTPAGGDAYLGFTTLQLAGPRPVAAVQVTLGDASGCELVGALLDGGSEGGVDVGQSSCGP